MHYMKEDTTEVDKFRLQLEYKHIPP